MNPRAGTAVDLDEVGAALPGLELRCCEPARIGTEVRAAVDDGAEIVAVVGGDGTVNAAIAGLIVAGPDRHRDGGRPPGNVTTGPDPAVPLLVVPAGTRNHFARTLGIEELADATAALTGGTDRQVDVGLVADRCFVNNASLGAYPRLVRRRDDGRRGPAGRLVRDLRSVFHLFSDGARLEVTVGDRSHRCWAVVIGNGCYGEGWADLFEREALDRGELDVRIVTAAGRRPRLRLFRSLLPGRSAPAIEQIVTSHITIAIPTSEVDVAVDGEVCRLDVPLEVSSLNGALTVRVP